MIKKDIKNGFTLIELLAVIVILAIIAVIATPIITGIIEDAKKSAFERSVEGIVEATKFDISEKLTENGYTYEFENGEIDLGENVKVTNAENLSGKVSYNKNGEVSYAIHNDKWCVAKSGNEASITEYNGQCKMPFENGYVIYFDVTTGEKCQNYHEDNSKKIYNGLENTKTTDNQNGCLKFYTFNYEEESDRVNLLLDHNISGKVSWANTGDNSSGPVTLLPYLKEATANWVGTETPTNYSLSQTTGGNYTISYEDEGYKARLITVNEVAKITGNTTLEESASNAYYYFDSNNESPSATCTTGNTTVCNYGWLYDRTKTDCTTYGCLNNGDAEEATIYDGYWTGTSTFGSTNCAWGVDPDGSLSYHRVYTSGGAYLRPVIEVLKTKLQ